MRELAATRDLHRSHQTAYEEAVERVGETRRTMVVAGIEISVRVAGQPLADALLPALSNPASGSSLPAGRLPVVLRAWDTTTSGVAPPRSPWGRDDFLPRDEIRGSGEDGVDVAYSLAWRTLSAWDRAARSGIYWIHDAAAMPAWEPTAPFRYLLHWALADQGCIVAHAAAVGGPSGAVLLVGAGGSGKSTSALTCVESGWAYLSDDYCALDTVGAPTAHALYRVGKLDDTSAALLPGLLDRCPPMDLPGPKQVLDLSQCDPDPTVGALALGAVVVPRVASSTGRAHRLAPAAGLRSLAPSSLYQLPGPRPGGLAALATAIEGLPVWGLDVGPDIERVPEALARLLDDSEAWPSELAGVGSTGPTGRPAGVRQ